MKFGNKKPEKIPIAISGALVPKAIINKPITKLGTLNLFANFEAALTNKSAPLTKISKEIINNMYLIVNSS